jgi:hypothetical protein
MWGQAPEFIGRISREGAITPTALMLLYNNVAELRQIRGAKATD